MGCNAWNHPRDCACGWGGDTAWARSSSSAQPVRRVPIPDGRGWRAGIASPVESFTVPNASCPVCRARVFYYQSPHGGRVFFDALGPPWPKHPCADNPISQREIVLPPSANVPLGAHQGPRQGWSSVPLYTVVGQNGCIIVWTLCAKIYSGIVHFGMRSAADVTIDGPLFIRKHAHIPGALDVSFIATSPDHCAAIEKTALLNANDISHINILEAALAGDARSQNAIGWLFTWGKPSAFSIQDWTLGRLWFEQAANLACPEGLNNLGVIYRDGLGVEPDPVCAAEYFMKAANFMQPQAMRHLAKCYEEGIGVDADKSQATFLRELANLIEAE